MRQDQYNRVLMNRMLPSAASLYSGGQAYLVQQDNAPCHKARTIMSFFERSNIEVLQWPEQSPGSMEALWQLLHVAWQAIPVDTLQNLVHSMPKYGNRSETTLSITA